MQSFMKTLTGKTQQCHTELHEDVDGQHTASDMLRIRASPWRLTPRVTEHSLDECTEVRAQDAENLDDKNRSERSQCTGDPATRSTWRGERAHSAKQFATRSTWQEELSALAETTTPVCQCRSSTGMENNSMAPQITQTGRSNKRVIWSRGAD